MVYLTRIEKFNAAHRLYVKSWSEEKNREVFGVCANPNYHGHNYTLEVSVCGHPDPVTGFIMDARALGDIIKEKVVAKFDHRNLNLDIHEFIDNLQPTTENMAILIFNLIAPEIPEPSRLYSVKLIETDKIFAEYYGTHERSN